MWMTIQSNTTHNNVCTWRNGLFLEWENATLSSAHNSEILNYNELFLAQYLVYD